MFRRIARSTVLCAACLLPVSAALIYRVLADDAGKTSDRQVIECDLGDVAPGAKIGHAVRISNHSADLRTVKTITKDCACLSLKLAAEQIPPGGQTELKVEYSTPTRRGPIEHVLNVAYDESSASTVIIVTATVGAWVELDQDKIDFGNACVGREVQEDIVVDVREPWPEAERSAAFTLEHGRILAATPSEDGTRVNYRLTFCPPCEAAGKEFRGEFSVQWLGKIERTLTIPCLANAVTPWTSTPSQAFFGILARHARRELKLEVRARSEADFHTGILEFTHDLGPCFEVKCSDTSPGALGLSVIFNPGVDASVGLRSGRINVVGRDMEILNSLA